MLVIDPMPAALASEQQQLGQYRNPSILKFVKLNEKILLKQF